MTVRKALLFISIIILICSASILISGPSLLLISLSETFRLPAGTIISWLGLVALPISVYYGSKKLAHPTEKRFVLIAIIIKILIVWAIIWLPVSCLLAGNMAFVFKQAEGFQGSFLAMRIFWYNSFFTVMAPIVLLVFYSAAGLIHRFRMRHKDKIK